MALFCALAPNVHPQIPDKIFSGKELPLADAEGVSVKVDEALPFEFPQLHRHGAAVHREIVRQLLAVKGDDKGRLPTPGNHPCLIGEVGQQLFAGGFAGENLELQAELAVFVCILQNLLEVTANKNRQQIL